MLNSLSLSLFLLAFFASITFNGFFRNIAKNYKILIDLPDKSRHFHDRPTPLTGGLGIFFGILVSGLLLTELTSAQYALNFDGNLPKNNYANEEPVSKNIAVDGEEYNLYLKEDINNKSISVQIDTIDRDKNNYTPSLDILPISSNKFKVTLQNGEEKFYISLEDKILEVSAADNSIINTFTAYDKELEKINLNKFSVSLYFFVFLILVFMMFDDYFGIKPLYRLIFQGLIVFAMIAISGVSIDTLGNLFGFGEIKLGIFSVPFTMFCVVGLMNAFNMIDGLNGICATCALVPIIFFTYIGNFSYGLIIPIAAILGFLTYNLGYLGKKRRVFLGDSGSNMLGFSVAFICIEYSQNIENISSINPVTALWLVAIPLIDCISVLLTRIRNGVMPFKPGRDHFHHKLLKLNINSEMIFLIFIMLSCGLAFIGYIFESFFPNHEYVSFYVFFIVLIFYFFSNKGVIKKNV